MDNVHAQALIAELRKLNAALDSPAGEPSSELVLNLNEIRATLVDMREEVVANLKK